MNLAVVDHECTELRADKAILLCSGMLPLGGKPKVWTYDDVGFEKGSALRIDRRLCLKVRDEMEKFDGWITWNGLLFDLPFLDDRLTLCKEDPLERRFARGLDMMWHAAQGKSTFSSRRLDWVAKALGCPYRKTDLDLNVWREAQAEVLGRFRSGRKNYNTIVEHCRADLFVTQWVYERLKNRVVSISKR